MKNQIIHSFRIKSFTQNNLNQSKNTEKLEQYKDEIDKVENIKKKRKQIENLQRFYKNPKCDRIRIENEGKLRDLDIANKRRCLMQLCRNGVKCLCDEQSDMRCAYYG